MEDELRKHFSRKFEKNTHNPQPTIAKGRSSRRLRKGRLRKDRCKRLIAEGVFGRRMSKYLEEQKSKEEEVKTLKKELQNSRQQTMASMKEDKSLKQEAANFKEEVKRLKDQQTINEKFKEKIQDSKRLEREVILLRNNPVKESIKSNLRTSQGL